MLALRRQESDGGWTFLVRAEGVGEIAEHIAATEEYQREQPLQITDDFGENVVADWWNGVWETAGRMSAEDLAILTPTTEPGIPIDIRDGQPVCSSCGGSVQCSGTVTVSFVAVDADCYEDDGEVTLTFDWADAGSAEFEPSEFHCVGCGAKLCDPGNLKSDGDDEADADEE